MRLSSLLMTILLAAAGPAGATPAEKAPAIGPAPRFTVKATRLGNPIILPGMAGLEGDKGANINGPSLIRVPSWVEKPLGKYYLYFGHHRGSYIRMAYADSLAGPWRIHAPGVLDLDQTSAFDHIASPDVVVDEKNRRIVMYFHGEDEDRRRVKGRPTTQATYRSQSSDGLHFTASPDPIAQPYAHSFILDGQTYLFAMSYKKTAFPAFLRSGQLYRSSDGRHFEAGPRVIDEMRHGAVHVTPGTLHLFFTHVGDSPERIYHSTIDTRAAWNEWTIGPISQIMAPATAAEGADLPLTVSRSGSAAARENALRDPAIYVEDGQVYLLYSIAGEQGIALARIDIAPAMLDPR